MNQYKEVKTEKLDTTLENYRPLPSNVERSNPSSGGTGFFIRETHIANAKICTNFDLMSRLKKPSRKSAKKKWKHVWDTCQLEYEIPNHPKLHVCSVYKNQQTALAKRSLNDLLSKSELLNPEHSPHIITGDWNVPVPECSGASIEMSILYTGVDKGKLYGYIQQICEVNGYDQLIEDQTIYSGNCLDVVLIKTEKIDGMNCTIKSIVLKKKLFQVLRLNILFSYQTNNIYHSKLYKI